jgi:anti-anti-sigma factor
VGNPASSIPIPGQDGAVLPGGNGLVQRALAEDFDHGGADDVDRLSFLHWIRVKPTCPSVLIDRREVCVMSLRIRRRPPTLSEPPLPPASARVPAAPTGNRYGPYVPATVTGRSATPLRVAWRAEPPHHSGASGTLVAAVAGEIDLVTAPLLQAALVDAVDHHREVCCDLSEVTFFGAAGINALVIAHERAARAGSRLLIRGAHGITRRVLQITGLEDLLSGP